MPKDKDAPSPAKGEGRGVSPKTDTSFAAPGVADEATAAPAAVVGERVGKGPAPKRGVSGASPWAPDEV